MIVQESLIPITEASHLIPNRPHVATVWRWCLKGVRGHRLETMLVGGRRFTSQEAIARFLASINGQPATTADNARRLREIEAAERELDDAGIR